MKFKLTHLLKSTQNVPTVQPALLFDATADAEVLHKAMKGLGTDEKALIQILCHRTSSQRTEINRTYKSNHGNVREYTEY